MPFDRGLIEWRAPNTTKSGNIREQVSSSAHPRAYMDRVDALFSPADWTGSNNNQICSSEIAAG